MKIKISILIILSVLCSSESFATTKDDLLNFENNDVLELNSKLRSIQEFGLQVGAQGGMIDRAKVIIETINRRAPDMDRIFGFQPLLSPDGLLPPVIDTISQGVETKESAQRIEFFGVSYNIVRPAIFVRVAPTWRDYIYTGLNDERLTISKLPEAIKPETAKEKKIWAKAVEAGWQIGVDQANAIYKENIQKLRRDYLGMIRYKTMEINGMVTTPVLATTTESAHIADGTMNIGAGAKTVEQPARMEYKQGDWGMSP